MSQVVIESSHFLKVLAPLAQLCLQFLTVVHRDTAIRLSQIDLGSD